MGKRRLSLAVKQRAQQLFPEVAAERLAAITASAGPQPRRRRATSDATSRTQRPAGEGVSADNGRPCGSSTDPLTELNQLLALPGQIVAVIDYLNPRTSRRMPGRIARWVFDVQLPDHRGEWTLLAQDSAILRNPRDFNRWAQWWGRDKELPRLTADDGRRALRLMHEVSERQTGAVEALPRSVTTSTEVDR